MRSDGTVTARINNISERDFNDKCTYPHGAVGRRRRDQPPVRRRREGRDRALAAERGLWQLCPTEQSVATALARCEAFLKRGQPAVGECAI
jgi:hypothetical protein